MAPLRASTTKSEWLPDDPTGFVPSRLWKLPFIPTWDDSRNQNQPTDSAEEGFLIVPIHNDDRVNTQYPGGSLLCDQLFRMTGDMSGEGDNSVLYGDANRGGVNTWLATELLLDVSS